MKKLIFVLGLLSITSIARAQESTVVSEQITIEGKVKNKISFSLKDINQYKTVSIDSFVIYNHLHVRKRAIKNIRGILLTDILTKAEIDESSPKLLSEYYFTCIATDNYKVVFSWNEIFNTEVGKGIIVVTEADGLKGESIPGKIVMLSAKDEATGRRFVKGISKIIVNRVN